MNTPDQAPQSRSMHKVSLLEGCGMPDSLDHAFIARRPLLARASTNAFAPASRRGLAKDRL